MIEVSNSDRDTYKNWFFFTFLYLVIDYGRPQDVLPIGFLKPGMIIVVILAGFLLGHRNAIVPYIKQIRLIWLFILLLAAYIPFAKNNYFAFMTTKGMLLFMPFILSTVICVNSLERLKKMIFAFICLMIYISLYSLLHHGLGSGAYFYDENDLSLYLNMWIPFCYFLFLLEKEKTKKIIYGIGLALGIISVIYSFSRGGFIGLVSIGLIAWLYSAKKFKSFMIICFAATMLYAYAGDAYWERISTAKNTEEGTAAERLESWKAGWRMFLDNPMGVGGNNFPVRFQEYQSDYFQKGMWGRAAHSLWFTLIPELGILGIIIYISLFYYNLKSILFLRHVSMRDNYEQKYLHALSSAFIVSISGYFASGTFLSVLYYPHYWYLTGMIVASVKIAKKYSVAGEILIREPI